MKSWYKSLTLWFNGIIASVPTLITLLAEQLPSVEKYIPDNIYSTLFVLLTAGNVIIRVYRTKTAIRLLPPLVK